MEKKWAIALFVTMGDFVMVLVRLELQGFALPAITVWEDLVCLNQTMELMVESVRKEISVLKDPAALTILANKVKQYFFQS